MRPGGIQAAGGSSVKVLSVNVGRPREAEWRGRTVRTAIFKDAVTGPVAVCGQNLEGDGQADLEVHGGVDKAVYAYPSEHYPFWQHELGVDALPWGAFGENLSTEGLLESEVAIGDRFRIGSVLLEASEPRIPCHKLALRHQRQDLPREFLLSGRSGIYFRVIEEGRLAAGDEIVRTHGHPERVLVSDVQGLVRGVGDLEVLRRASQHPALSEAWREKLRRRLDGADDAA
jgi:MOSC domain-containing protein YiiM